MGYITAPFEELEEILNKIVNVEGNSRELAKDGIQILNTLREGFMNYGIFYNKSQNMSRMSFS
jgi:hypothetical protein